MEVRLYHECEHHPCSWGFSRQSQYLRKEVAREKVARVNEMITLGKMLPSLSANSLQLYANVRRPFWRICMWVLGLKGLIKSAKQSLYSRGLRNGDEGCKEKNSPAHVLFPRACRSRALIVRPLCINNYTRSNEFTN